MTSFIAPYVYDNFNEIYVPTVNPNETVGRRRRDAESEDPVFAWMYGISVSHDGINYGELKYVVVMDTSCQATDATTSESSRVTLKVSEFTISLRNIFFKKRLKNIQMSYT